MNDQESPGKKSRYKVGYVAPGRAGKVSIKVFVAPELRDDFKKTAKMLGATSESLLTDMVTALVEQCNDPKEAPDTLRRNAVKGYKEAIRQAALRLAATLK